MALVVEGNGAPDVDIMPRHDAVGLCQQRFGALLAWHLARRVGELPADAGAEPLEVPVVI
jgi:hypothetical protein